MLFIPLIILIAIIFTSGKAGKGLKREFSIMRAVIVTLMYTSTQLLLATMKYEIKSLKGNLH